MPEGRLILLGNLSSSLLRQSAKRQLPVRAQNKARAAWQFFSNVLKYASVGIPAGIASVNPAVFHRHPHQIQYNHLSAERDGALFSLTQSMLILWRPSFCG